MPRWEPPSSPPPVPPPAGSGGAPLPPSGPNVVYGGSQSHSSAVASLVCGIMGLATVCFCPVASPILGVAAIVLGSRAKHAIRAAGGTDTGEGLATGGVITGWLALVLSVLLLAAIVAAIALGVASSQHRVFFNSICTGPGC